MKNLIHRHSSSSSCSLLLQFTLFGLLLLLLTLASSSAESLYSPDYNGKVNVRVGEILRDRESGGGGGSVPRGGGGTSSSDTPTGDSLGSGDRTGRAGSPGNMNNNQQLTAEFGSGTGEFHGVDIQVLGRPIDLTVLKNLQPDLSPKTLQQLRIILGEKFDREWTSETSPKSLNEPERGSSPSLSAGERRGLFDPKLSLEVQSLNLTLIDSAGASYLIPPHISEMFQSWLLRYASCEMDYIWEDLGPLFWPRWIRRGVCLNSSQRSCSWPPGMKCRASGSRALHILHWKCQTDTPALKQRRDQDFQAEKEERRKRKADKWRQRRRRDRTQGEPAGEENEQQPQQRSLEWKQQRYERRVRRITRRLSLTASGYHCHWQMQKYLISDRCHCACN